MEKPIDVARWRDYLQRLSIATDACCYGAEGIVIPSSLLLYFQTERTVETYSSSKVL
ncbi:hypothetical protein KQX54_006404, partial [Cotesia glomerata]